MCQLRGVNFAILGFMCAISQYWRLLWKTKRLMSGQKSQYLGISLYHLSFHLKQASTCSFKDS
jgi:hypothetical protein